MALSCVITVCVGDPGLLQALKAEVDAAGVRAPLAIDPAAIDVPAIASADAMPALPPAGDGGAQLAYLAPTPDNGTGPSEFTILASQQKAGTNVLTFFNSSTTWLWGVTDVMLQSIPKTYFVLTPGVSETGSYGKGFHGPNHADARVPGRSPGPSTQQKPPPRQQGKT